MKASPSKNKILIIKLSALGDVILAEGAIRAIKEAHISDDIDIITQKEFSDICKKMNPLCTIIPYQRCYKSLWRLASKIRTNYYTKIYDLQTNNHTKYLYYLSWGSRTAWSNHVATARFFHRNPNRNHMHTVDRLHDQLFYAGISQKYEPSVTYLHKEALSFSFNIPAKFSLLLPGSSVNRPEKRWHGYAKLAQYFLEKNIIPILIGGKDEAKLLEDIACTDNRIINLCFKTHLEDLVYLAKKTCIAIGNDTGPTHIISLANCLTLTLFSHHSNPDLCKARGLKSTEIRVNSLDALSFNEVANKVESMLVTNKNIL